MVREASAARLHGDGELHAAGLVHVGVEDLVVERPGGVLLQEDPGAVLLEDPVARVRGVGGDARGARGRPGTSWLIRRPACSSAPDWSTMVFTTVLAFSVRVSTSASPS